MKKLLLVVFDAWIGVLQSMRNSIEPAADKGEQGGEKKRVKVAEAEKAPVTKPRKLEDHEARPVFVFLLALVIGTIAGMLFSFRLFSTMIVHQAERIDDQHTYTAILERVNGKIQDTEAGCREELRETQNKLSETKKNLFQAIVSPRKKGSKSSAPAVVRSDSKGTAFPEYGGNSSGLGGAMTGEAQKSATCNIDSAHPEKGMANCLEGLKSK